MAQTSSSFTGDVIAGIDMRHSCVKKTRGQDVVGLDPERMALSLIEIGKHSEEVSKGPLHKRRQATKREVARVILHTLWPSTVCYYEQFGYVCSPPSSNCNAPFKHVRWGRVYWYWKLGFLKDLETSANLTKTKDGAVCIIQHRRLCSL